MAGKNKLQSAFEKAIRAFPTPGNKDSARYALLTMLERTHDNINNIIVEGTEQKQLLAQESLALQQALAAYYLPDGSSLAEFARAQLQTATIMHELDFMLNISKEGRAGLSAYQQDHREVLGKLEAHLMTLPTQ